VSVANVSVAKSVCSEFVSLTSFSLEDPSDKDRFYLSCPADNDDVHAHACICYSSSADEAMHLWT